MAAYSDMKAGGTARSAGGGTPLGVGRFAGIFSWDLFKEPSRAISVVGPSRAMIFRVRMGYTWRFSTG